jgi:hypothetical protein
LPLRACSGEETPIRKVSLTTRQAVADKPEDLAIMNLFLAGSMTELVSACVVRRHAPSTPAALLFNLGLNREPEQVRQEVLHLREFWSKIVFLEPNTCPGTADLSLPPLSRLAAELRKSKLTVASIREALREILDDSSLRRRGCGLSLFFTHLHPYVLYVFGLLPGGQRVYFPHGLDQPRQHQLAEVPHYHRPRSVRTLLETFRYQRRIRLSFFAVGLWLRLAGRARVPVPFSGVDYSVVFSPVHPPVSHERVSEETLQGVLRELADRMRMRDDYGALLGGRQLDRTCLLLLPELDAQHENRNYTSAVGKLMDAVSRKEPVNTFVLKPHPRSSYAMYLNTLSALRRQHPDEEILAWPKEAVTVLSELVCADWRVRCAASIGSCALPPWASFGVPHYVSVCAAKCFDDGWQLPGLLHRVYPSYADFVYSLAQEGLVQVLELGSSS